MAELITMPAIVADATEAVLASWMVSAGDEIHRGDPIAEVETEKATVELTSEADGVVDRFLVEPGASVEVGAPVAAVRAAGEDADAVERLLASAGGDRGPAGETGAEAPTPSDATENAPGESERSGEGGDSPSSGEAAQRSSPSAGRDHARVFSSPLARRIARENQLDIASLPGSGPSGRILRKDVERALAARQEEAAVPAPAEPGSPTPEPASAERPAADAPAPGYRDEPLTGMRRAIARRLTESKTTAPHFYLSVDVQMDALLATRRQINAALEGTGGRATVNDMILKALGAALTAVPRANATWEGDAIRYYESVDLAMAIATEGGLLTPVVRDVAGQGLGALSRATADLKDRAARGRIRQHELEGGTFSVSNLGMYGTREFSAIINPPHAGIIACGASEQRAVVRDGELAAATMMTATLSADHRVVDGALAAELMRSFKHTLENPLAVLL
ncbi:dihydrolipoamide acetyltransferase family protein [Rothia halotolerans]|uniref:dihydrolipoamide acetyltransferase family protein n=1 Tax=Rothia halotolerans TaxID=405770 RepID=UPI00101D0C67|nr:dihydrolipoamide acetyltransferase family protein [Rothia halotolerans]